MAAFNLFSSTPPAQAGTAVRHVTDTPQAFDAAFRDAHIDVISREGSAVLAPVDYIIDDIGNRIGKTTFSEEQIGRKVFTLDRPEAPGVQDAAKADIYVWSCGGPATFNGEPIELKAPAWGVWHVATIPGEKLRQGENVIEFGPGAFMAYDLDKAPAQNSQASADGGKTWSPAEGEFLVHIRLHRHPEQGMVTSQVIDLASPQGEDVIRPRIKVNDVTIQADAAMPAGTSVALEARSGHSPRLDQADQWTPWSPADAVEPRQYVQWRATLKTDDGRATPELKAVTVEADVDILADADAQGLELVSFDNRHIVHRGYDFTFQPPSPNLEELRTRFNLDEVVAEGETELEKMVLLRNWVRRQWPHNDAGSAYRKWNAIEILSAPEGEHGMCVHYAVAFTQCAQALGYNARQVIIRSHYVSEFWSNEHGKWVLMDVETVQGDTPNHYGTGHYVDTRTGEPMSGLELLQAIHSGDVSHIVQKLYLMDEDGEHRLHERTYGPEGFASYRKLAHLPRNNYLDQLEPWEENHGYDHYHSNEYLWYKNEPYGMLPEYSLHTSREGDIDWTVNQVQVYAYAGESSETVELHFETDMPNLQHLAYRLNGGEWQTLSPDPEAAKLDWSLESGENRLEIKPVNQFGLDGMTSTLLIRK